MRNTYELFRENREVGDFVRMIRETLYNFYLKYTVLLLLL